MDARDLASPVATPLSYGIDRHRRRLAARLRRARARRGPRHPHDRCAVRAERLSAHRSRGQSDVRDADDRDGAGDLHVAADADRRRARGRRRQGRDRAFAGRRQGLCQSASRRADDGRVDGHSRDVCPSAPRGCDSARHAGDGRGAALERRSVHLPRGERGGRAPVQRSQAGLRRPGGRRGEAARAGEGRAQGARGIQARRNAAPAPRHCRQGRRPREVRHRHPASWNEVRRRGGLADLRWKARRRRRSEGEGRPRRNAGRPTRGCGRGRCRPHVGGEAGPRCRCSAVGRGAERQTLHDRYRRPACVRLGKAGHRRAARRRCRRGHCRRGAQDRRGLRTALSCARDDGADELHGAHQQGWLRHLGRHADPGDDTSRGHEAHRPRARAGAYPQPSARRRVRAAPRIRRDRARRADRAAGARTGAGDLDARGRHPARHVSAVLLRPPERRRGRTGQAARVVASHRRLVHHRALQPGVDQERRRSETRSRLGEPSPTSSGAIHRRLGRGRSRREFRPHGGAGWV